MAKHKLGAYRNLKLMEGRDNLWQFEVKTKDGWKLLTGLYGSTKLAREEFAQKTANDWINR